MEPHRAFPAEAAASGVVLGEAIELLQVRLEPKQEPGHFPSKRAVARAHPRRLVDLFGKVHNSRLKPEGLVETVGDLAEVMVHGRLPKWRFLRHEACDQLFREVFALKMAIWGVTFLPPQVGQAIFPAARSAAVSTTSKLFLQLSHMNSYLGIGFLRRV